MKRTYLSMSLVFALVLALFTSCATTAKKKETKKAKKKPNVVIIYMDDLGYGDLSAYGATAVKTPNIDKIINGGVKFTNAYATSATCTPSRYAILTGTYPWRNKDAHILPGSAPLLIGVNQYTLPKMMKSHGYATAAVGKWHLGLGTGIVNWNKHITPGPNEVGFDYSYIMAATQDRVPTVLIKNGTVEGLDPKDPIEVSYKHNFDHQPTGKSNPELCKLMWHHGHNATIINGIPRIGYMKGGKKACWDDQHMSEQFLAQAQNFVKTHKDKPFFLYYAMQQPHVPRTPSPKFAGKSGLGARGDVILEADWTIGQFMKTLKSEGLLDNTLVIFSSDNGPVLNDGYNDQSAELAKKEGHSPTGPLRGGKYSLYDGGTRIPFATYWKGVIKPGVSDALVCQMDLMSSINALLGYNKTFSDSKNTLDAFMGKTKTGRESLVLEATSRTSYRKGDWILIPPYKGRKINTLVNIELGNGSDFMLFNLKDDVAEQHNLAKAKPEKLKEMLAEFKAIRGEYKTTKELKLH